MITQQFHVSIDGPTASGKTTLGIELAKSYGAAFLDTGLTYRALAYALTRQGLDASDGSWRALVEHQPSLFKIPGPDGLGHPIQPEIVLYKGEDITDKVWAFDVDNRVDQVAMNPTWRAQILDFHKETVNSHDRIVVAGRDIATTLLKRATLHVFLTANFAVRRERRRAQHRMDSTRSVVVGAVTARDLDTLEAVRLMPNAIVIDTTHLSSAAVFASIRKDLLTDVCVGAWLGAAGGLGCGFLWRRSRLVLVPPLGVGGPVGGCGACAVGRPLPAV
jgi:CMP/dCMP kinase